MNSWGDARPLRLIHSSPAVEPPPSGWFCGHCAAPSPDGLAPEPYARVCVRCGMGLMLETRSDAMPQPGEAFVIVDRSLRVQALSERAERLLALSEFEAVDLPVAQLLECAEGERPDRARLADAILMAARSSDELSHVRVRPAGTFGVRLRARISACGPPRAALLVLEYYPRALRTVD